MSEREARGYFTEVYTWRLLPEVQPRCQREREREARGYFTEVYT